MERFVKGDVVVLPFPFSDLSSVKKRPALILATSDEDFILAQITSNNQREKFGVNLELNHFKEGKLNSDSIIRTNKIFTADRRLFLYRAAKVKESKIREVENSLVALFTE